MTIRILRWLARIFLGPLVCALTAIVDRYNFAALSAAALLIDEVQAIDAISYS